MGIVRIFRLLGNNAIITAMNGMTVLNKRLFYTGLAIVSIAFIGLFLVSFMAATYSVMALGFVVMAASFMTFSQPITEQQSDSVTPK